MTTPGSPPWPPSPPTPRVHVTLSIVTATLGMAVALTATHAEGPPAPPAACRGEHACDEHHGDGAHGDDRDGSKRDASLQRHRAAIVAAVPRGAPNHLPDWNFSPAVSFEQRSAIPW